MYNEKNNNASVGSYMIAALLSLLDFEFLRGELKKFYAEEWRWRKFDLVAMLKLDIFRIIKRKNFTSVVEYLAHSPAEAKLLGFSELPSSKTTWHWENVRLGGAGLKHLFLVCVLKLKFLLLPFGIILGKHVSQDSTPVASTREDPDAEFNPHYNVKMHKAHIITDSAVGIPLTFTGSGGLDYDGNYLLPLVEEAIATVGVVPEECAADGHYGSFENHAKMNMKGIRLLVKPAKDDVYHPEADEDGLWQEHQKLWHEKDWQPPGFINFRRMLEFLYLHGKSEIVGMFFRNRIMEIKNTEEFLNKYHRRSGVNEGLNGLLKDNTGFGRMRVSGSRKRMPHIGIHLLAFLAVGPLFKLQHGCASELMGLGHVIA